MDDPVNAALANPEKLASLTRRMTDKIARGHPDECWEWQSRARCHGGYGAINAGRGPKLRAHRVAWALHNGPLPDGLGVLHSCDNPPCCNPDHLFLGKQDANIADMRAKGRASRPPIHRGESHPHASIPDAEIPRIKVDPRSHEDLADVYGVSSKTIYRIRKGLSRCALAHRA